MGNTTITKEYGTTKKTEPFIVFDSFPMINITVHCALSAKTTKHTAIKPVASSVLTLTWLVGRRVALLLSADVMHVPETKRYNKIVLREKTALTFVVAALAVCRSDVAASALHLEGCTCA